MIKAKTTKISSTCKAKRIDFKLSNPHAKEVFLVGSFTNWQAKPVLLRKDKQGIWKASVSLKPGRHEYKFLVDGSWQNDPTSQKYADNSFGSRNSLVEVR